MVVEHLSLVSVYQASLSADETGKKRWVSDDDRGGRGWYGPTGDENLV